MKSQKMQITKIHSFKEIKNKILHIYCRFYEPYYLSIHMFFDLMQQMHIDMFF